MSHHKNPYHIHHQTQMWFHQYYQKQKPTPLSTPKSTLPPTPTPTPPMITLKTLLQLLPPPKQIHLQCIVQIIHHHCFQLHHKKKFISFHYHLYQLHHQHICQYLNLHCNNCHLNLIFDIFNNKTLFLNFTFNYFTNFIANITL